MARPRRQRRRIRKASGKQNRATYLMGRFGLSCQGWMRAELAFSLDGRQLHSQCWIIRIRRRAIDPLRYPSRMLILLSVRSSGADGLGNKRELRIKRVDPVRVSTQLRNRGPSEYIRSEKLSDLSVGLAMVSGVARVAAFESTAGPSPLASKRRQATVA